jgi:hypothetical protein
LYTSDTIKKYKNRINHILGYCIAPPPPSVDREQKMKYYISYDEDRKSMVVTEEGGELISLIGFEEIIVSITPEPIAVTCSKDGSIPWGKKYVGDYIYCVVPQRPCLCSSCTFSRYYLDGTVDIYVGKC